MPEARGEGPQRRRARASVHAAGEGAADVAKPSHALVDLSAAAAVALYLAFQVYAPALSGPFVFDDTFLPYHTPGFSQRAGRLDPAASGRCSCSVTG